MVVNQCGESRLTIGQRPKDPLRPLTPDEQSDLESISRARSAPVEAVIRTKILLAVAGGITHTQAAHGAGWKSNDAMSTLVQEPASSVFGNLFDPGDDLIGVPTDNLRGFCNQAL